MPGAKCTCITAMCRAAIVSSKVPTQSTTQTHTHTNTQKGSGVNYYDCDWGADGIIYKIYVSLSTYHPTGWLTQQISTDVRLCVRVFVCTIG